MKKLIIMAFALCLGTMAITSCQKDGGGFINSDGTTTGGTTTNGTSNGHEYVDLGLSVKWATCNVGASSPSDYGGYYAWGETATKTSYTWGTYKHCKGTRSTLTKYCTTSTFGTVDNKTVLESSDDVAHVKWGGSWRMPTNDEWKELCNSCTWTWTTKNGVDGYEVSKNGNSIFLPAAGYRSGSSVHLTGYGSYWSSSLNTSIPISARYCGFSSSSSNPSALGDRYDGYPVRPVIAK